MKQHSPGFLKAVQDAKSRIKEISVEEVRRKQEKGDPFQLIDVREDSEWEEGRAKGAIHIGRGVLERDVEKKVPDPEGEIVLYCGGGFRSALAADSLQKMGYKRVRSMAGGWSAWVESGSPVEK